MTSYRRNFVAGASYFFTVNVEDRRLHLLTEHVAILGAAFRETKVRRRFTIDAIVILPDHLHAIWTMPDRDSDFSTRSQRIKSSFSRALPRTEPISQSRAAKSERGIWQRRYWEHTLRDADDFAARVDYIHFNPVRHGPAPEQRNWLYSSIHRTERQG